MGKISHEIVEDWDQMCMDILLVDNEDLLRLLSCLIARWWVRLQTL